MSEKLYRIEGEFHIESVQSDAITENVFNPEEVEDIPTELLDSAEWHEAFGKLYEDQWIGTADLLPMTLAMMQEASEAMNELNFKPWKQKEVNLDAYKEELADVFIFLMVCAKISGMSANDLIELTTKKHMFNKIRPDHDRNKK